VRRSVIAVLSAVFLVFAGLPASQVAAHPRCTWVGTPEHDVHFGTRYHDVLCAHGGPDYVNGKRGADVVRGDGGRDTLVGGKGKDIIRGGHGGDKLYSVDGHSGDTVIGGPNGRRFGDTCYIDPGDHPSGCEILIVSRSR
jgi:Ca2+-binding RTX toxin-like protein